MLNTPVSQLAKMGAKQSLTDDLLQFKLTSKELARDSKKAYNKGIAEMNKAVAAKRAGNHAGAQIYCANAIREKNVSLQYLKLSSQIDGVASRLEQAIRMQKTSATMQQTVKGMSSAMKSMNIEQISSTMTQFSGLFQDMDVSSATISGAMDSSNAAMVPQEEVDALLSKIDDMAQVDTAKLLASVGNPATTEPAKEAPVKEKAPEDNIEERLAALRR